MSLPITGVLCNKFIEQFLNLFCSTFDGVYSCDNIPNHLVNKKTFQIVVNLSKQDNQGSHFISILKENNQVFYLESFALPLLNDDISDFIIKNNVQVKKLKHQIQSLSSSFCGFYCILFCLLKDNIMKTSKLPFLFVHEDHLQENDKLCLSYILKCIEKK